MGPVGDEVSGTLEELRGEGERKQFIDVALLREPFDRSKIVTGARLADLVSAICRESPVRALSLTAYDPGFDPEGRVPPIALDLLRIVTVALDPGP